MGPIQYEKLTVALFEKLINKYHTPRGSVNPWFGRKMKDLSPDDQRKVIEEVRTRGWNLPVSWEEKFPKATPATTATAEKTPTKPTKSKKRIEWTEEEWNLVAHTVYELRKKHPVPHIASLIDRAIKHLPEDRRRKLAGKHGIKPLLDRLSEIEAQVPTNKEQFATSLPIEDVLGLFKEKVLQNLSNDEIKERFRGHVLSTLDLTDLPRIKRILALLPSEDIYKYFGKQTLEHLTPDEVAKNFSSADLLDALPFAAIVGFVAEHVTERAGDLLELFSFLNLLPEIKKGKAPISPETTVAAPPKIRKPKVGIIGTLPGQEQILKERLQQFDLTFVDQNQYSAVLNSQDVIVIWCRFVSHSVYYAVKEKAQDCQIIEHHGGLTRMIQSIRDAF